MAEVVLDFYFYFLFFKSLIFQTKHIVAIHKARCPNFNSSVHVSLDGVSECKSNINSFEVYSLRFTGCRTIYPIQIVRPIGKHRIDHQYYLDLFLTDICMNCLIIKAFLGDKPKRSTAKFTKDSGAYYPCEYCESKGQLFNAQDDYTKRRKTDLQEQKQTIEDQLEIAYDVNDEPLIKALELVQKSVNEAIKSVNKKNSNIVWPASSMSGPKRTVEKVLEIVQKLDDGNSLSIDEAKGIMGRSLFLDIPYFDFIHQIPPEYLHGVCLGVVKKTIILTFNVGENRPRITTRKLSEISKFDKLMAKIKSTREFSRRARNLDFSVMKGQEFRNIIIIYFPLVVDCIEPNARERKLWLLLAYMVRACVLPENEFEGIDMSVVKYCGMNYYNIYEELFGPKNCSYYTHIIGSHMPEIRSLGPLTLSSAFPFESFYGELRHAFCPGTSSPGKQMMQKILFKRTFAHHCCESSIFFSPKETPLESNCYIYTYFENNYNFYQILSIENDIFNCCVLQKFPTFFPETPTLNWEKIGVFQCGETTEQTLQISRNDVAGKIIKVKDLLITCPNNVLREK